VSLLRIRFPFLTFISFLFRVTCHSKQRAIHSVDDGDKMSASSAPESVLSIRNENESSAECGVSCCCGSNSPVPTFVAFPFLLQTFQMSLSVSSIKWIDCSVSNVSIIAVVWSIPCCFPKSYDGFVPVVLRLYDRLLSYLCFSSFLFDRRPKRSSTLAATKVSTVPSKK
jgi:hypothetical protein